MHTLEATHDIRRVALWLGQRTPSPSHPDRLLCLLPQIQNSSVSGQGRARAEKRPAASYGRDRGAARSGRPPSPLRAPRGLIASPPWRHRHGRPSLCLERLAGNHVCSDDDPAPDVGVRACEHALGFAKPPRIDLPSAHGSPVGEGQGCHVGVGGGAREPHPRIRTGYGNPPNRTFGLR